MMGRDATIEFDTLYEERFFKQQRQNQRYLKLLFNDHFMIFLFIAFGGAVLLYRQYAGEHLAIFGSVLSLWSLIGLAIVLLGLTFGHLQSYLEAADRVFLNAADEFFLENYFVKVKNRAFLYLLPIQAAFFLLALPFLIQAGCSSAGLLLALFLLQVAVKVGLLKKEERALFLTYPSGQKTVNWQQALKQAERQADRRNRFFALFAAVPGRQSPVKRRAFLDLFLSKMTFQRNPQEQLAYRILLRYQGGVNLVFRQWLLVLVLLPILRKEAEYWPLLLVAGFAYLAKRQLLPVFKRAEGVLWNPLLFFDQKKRQKDFDKAINRLLYPMLLLLDLEITWLFSASTGLYAFLIGWGIVKILTIKK